MEYFLTLDGTTRGLAFRPFICFASQPKPSCRASGVPHEQVDPLDPRRDGGHAVGDGQRPRRPEGDGDGQFCARNGTGSFKPTPWKQYF